MARVLCNACRSNTRPRTRVRGLSIIAPPDDELLIAGHSFALSSRFKHESNNRHLRPFSFRFLEWMDDGRSNYKILLRFERKMFRNAFTSETLTRSNFLSKKREKSPLFIVFIVPSLILTRSIRNKSMPRSYFIVTPDPLLRPA